MRVLRRGWTLHEMLITLSVTAGILALVAHMALGQLRLFAGVAESAAVRTQTAHATEILARLLWDVTPGQDIVLAQDSMVEFHAAVGTGVVCATGLASLTLPEPRRPGAALSAFSERPAAGDIAHVLFSDSTGTTWLTFHLSSDVQPATACTAFSPGPAWRLPLREAITVPVGAVVRVRRPVRASLYRASDSRWYLGIREWNGAAARYNAIQPVAGPLRAYSGLADSTGLSFSYGDASGQALGYPADPGQIAAVRVVARALSSGVASAPGSVARPNRRDADSSWRLIPLVNSR